MRQPLYHELASWYRLVDPPRDHEDEAVCFRAAFERAMEKPETLLELGAGAGHNALHLKAHFRCTLADISPQMLALSRALNPECEHVVGDMRTLRLGKLFDAVLIHDAIMYMTSESDLHAAVRTACAHLRPGGALIVAPDCTRDSFVEYVEHQHESEGARTLHLTMWQWDPDPSDDTFVTEFALLMRDASELKAVHDRHVTGLFSLATWRKVFESNGLGVEMIARPIGDEKYDEVFLCKKPLA